MDLKDDGVRREFGTGAVRDTADGKGRCDLLPLKEIGKFFGPGTTADEILWHLETFLRVGDPWYLYAIIQLFTHEEYSDRETAILELAKHYEDGARKYSDRNWEKGIPLHCYIDSAARHYLKFRRGDRDEPHDRAFLWNLFGAIWTLENHPEMIDLPFKEVKNGETITS